MSEYWKSTPKYWCKHCKTYVRDTKLEKANHEATPKHQGNLKRFLKDLHRGHEKDEKDKERAKSEVARLNGLVAGVAASGSSSSSGFGRGPTPSVPKPHATASQRKQQLAQLAEMGISIPDEFRPDLAMAGEWQVTSERIVEPEVGNKKLDSAAQGVRKRAAEDEEEEAVAFKKSRLWSAYRTHPEGEIDGDLDVLLNKTVGKSKEPATKSEEKSEEKFVVKDDIKMESAEGAFLDISAAGLPGDLEVQHPEVVKKEPSNEQTILHAKLPSPGAGQMQEVDEIATPGVVFKKRKAKNIRQK